MIKKFLSTKRGMIIFLCILVLGMFGFAFALVPLYDVFCDITGINGKTGGRMRATQVPELVAERNVTVEFVTRIDKDIQWDFGTHTNSVVVHPGEPTRVDFYATNTADHPVTAVAIPSVSPGWAAKYLLKTECFCFNEQTLAAGESVVYPMIFFIDPSMPEDIPRLTLSYTLYAAANVPTQ
jgi:cytochrome c oxidase assembly protein subunit 11